MKRVLALLALAASLAVVASPVLAAETYHWRGTGNGMEATWTNVEWSEEGLAPGTYAETWLMVATEASDSYDTFGDGLCVSYYTFTVTESGEISDDASIDACGAADVFTMQRRLGGGHVTGTIPVTSCLEWDENWEECIGGWAQTGEFQVDVNFTGEGPILRSHNVSSGGTAGYWQYTWHGSHQSRSATASGTVAYNGASIIDGAPNAYATLWTSRDASVEINVCRLTSGC